MTEQKPKKFLRFEPHVLPQKVDEMRNELAGNINIGKVTKEVLGMTTAAISNSLDNLGDAMFNTMVAVATQDTIKDKKEQFNSRAEFYVEESDSDDDDDEGFGVKLRGFNNQYKDILQRKMTRMQANNEDSEAAKKHNKMMNYITNDKLLEAIFETQISDNEIMSESKDFNRIDKIVVDFPDRMHGLIKNSVAVDKQSSRYYLLKELKWEKLKTANMHKKYMQALLIQQKFRDFKHTVQIQKLFIDDDSARDGNMDINDLNPASLSLYWVQDVCPYGNLEQMIS